MIKAENSRENSLLFDYLTEIYWRQSGSAAGKS
jgi:hypothetical protein